ncbi:thermonuclease family protein [Catellatospora sp. KI3]|uniref:thermonuclease family protein n=1 Tax=Catellatospora sp. KI3 TaxID=3041620 RepID=UPI0024830AD2|nr:thermonuclease family protein [Catellatospora sp. KI3]MDI1464380.1 thermonuclease family protein [Catellatospora sp. KI3]
MRIGGVRRRRGRGRELVATGFWVVVLVLGGLGWWWYQHTRPAPTAAPAPGAPPPGAQQVRVQYPLDGDSIAVTATPGPVVDTAGEVQLRLLGIDAPERHGTDGTAQCWADRAYARLRQLAPPGGSLWILPDTQRRDPYDRYLVYAWTADGTFVNADLARRGDVRELAIPPNLAHQRELHAAVERARADRHGLWSTCTGK